MSVRFNLLLVLLLTASGAALAGAMWKSQEVVYIDRGGSDYTIMVDNGAAPAERYAAEELQRWLEEMTGVKLPIETGGRGGTSEIIIGQGGRLRRFAPDLNVEELGVEEYIIRNVGPHLVIVGGSPRATLYGVYGLLEDHLGCRWFTPEVHQIPRRKRVVLPMMNKRVSPVLEYREPFLLDNFDGDWLARNRMNSAHGRFAERHGGHVRFGGGLFVHTFEILLPPHKWFDTNPDYFSLVNGKRLKERSQICATHPDVMRIVTEEVLKRIEADPTAYVYSVSQNDWHNYCECVNCTALADLEGSQMAPVLQLVNHVAEAVEEKFPGKAIETLAYQYTRKPPATIRPRHNVIIRLCSIECCFMHSLAACDSQENRDFRADAERWSRVADRIWVWDYVTNFHEYMLPHPNLRVLRDNVQFFVKNNVRGIFEQGNYQSYNGDFAPLKAYMLAKFLWNPRYDEETAMTEFLNGVYGKKAARHIRSYIDMLHDKVADENIHADIWGSAQEVEYITPSILKRGDRLWDRAERAVRNDPDRLERVKAARLSFDYAWIEHNRGGVYIYDHANFLARTSPEYRERVQKFFEVARRNGVTQMAETRVTLDVYENELCVPEIGDMRQFTPLDPVDVPGQPGLACAVYDGSWDFLPDFSALTPDDTFVATMVDYEEANRSVEYGLVFTGYIEAPRDGVYRFYISSNDGSRMMVGDNALLIDNDGLHRTMERSGFVALRKGLHPIKVWFFQAGGGQELKLRWGGPGIKGKEIVPASALFH